MKKAKTVLSSSDLSKTTEKQSSLLKDVLLMIYLDINKTSQTHGLSIYMMFGTLLGAVRHKGFIPWDDDIDLCMKYEDFPSLVRYLESDYPGKYEFTGLGFDKNGDPFMALKIMLSKTIQTEIENTGWKFERGIYIDVFPIIKTYESSFLRSIDKEKIAFFIHSNALAYEFAFPPEGLLHAKGNISKYYKKRRFIGFFCNLFFGHHNKRLIKRYQKSFAKSDCYAVPFLIGFSKKPFTSSFFQIFRNTIFAVTNFHHLLILTTFYQKTLAEIT